MEIMRALIRWRTGRKACVPFRNSVVVGFMSKAKAGISVAEVFPYPLLSFRAAQTARDLANGDWLHKLDSVIHDVR